MNTNMLAKWFNDNNFLIKEEKDRLKYLVFTAAACLGIDEEVSIKDKEIILDLENEEYDFKEETLNLLNCINRDMGYLKKYKDSYMYDSILIDLGDSINTSFDKLSDYYLNYRNDILLTYEGYNFSKKTIKINDTIYILNNLEDLDENLPISSEKDIYEVYKINGEVVFI